MAVLFSIIITGCVQQGNIEISADDKSLAEREAPTATISENKVMVPEFPEISPQENSSKRGERYSEYNYFDDVSSLPSCGDTKEFFTTLPLALADLTTIDPLGLLSPTAHTFPAPHLYFRIKRESSSFESPVAKVPLYAPALKQAYDSASTDRCDEYTLTYKTGPINWKKCDKNVNIKISEGDLMGYAGGGSGQVALDFAAYDARIEPHNYASPHRIFRKELVYNVCPLDYFSASLSQEYKSRLGGYSHSRGVIISPTCGKVIQDIQGTAKGNWFAPGIDTTRSGQEPPNLALVQGHIEQDLQYFSNGESTKNSNLEMGLYYFEPGNSGLVNRDFSQVKPDGKVYCYETLNTYQNNQRKIIITQLIDLETLKIEGLNTADCGSGPWSFSNPVEFER